MNPQRRTCFQFFDQQVVFSISNVSKAPFVSATKIQPMGPLYYGNCAAIGSHTEAT